METNIPKAMSDIDCYRVLREAGPKFIRQTGVNDRDLSEENIKTLAVQHQSGRPPLFLPGAMARGLPLSFCTSTKYIGFDRVMTMLSIAQVLIYCSQPHPLNPRY